MVKRIKDAGVKVGVTLPKKHVEIIDQFVEAGEFLSRSDFVRECVKDYLRRLGLISPQEVEECVKVA